MKDCLSFRKLLCYRFNLCLAKEERDERRARRRKSRWGGGEHDKTFIPGMPTILPSTLNKEQEEAYLCKLIACLVAFTLFV